MTRFIALAALGLSVVACVAVPAYMQRQTQQAIDRALRQREAQLVERYKPLLHELGDRYMAAAAFENAQTVDQMVDALVQIVRAAAEAERQAKLQQGSDKEAVSTEESVSEPSVEGASRLVNHEAGSTVSTGGRSKRERSGAVVEDLMEFGTQDEAPRGPLPGQIAFVATEGFGLRKGDGSDIFLVDADGGNMRRITRTSAVEMSVTLSLDGSKIAWVSDLDGDLDIVVAGSDGKDPVNLTEDLDLSFEPFITWLPDSEHLGFTMTRDGQPSVHLFNTSTREVTQLLDNARYPTWSPDGKRMTFARDMRLMLADADGTNVTTPGEHRPYLHRPARWLPDGRGFVFSSLADLSRRPDLERERIFSMYLWNEEKQQAEKLTRTPLPEIPMGCSPDGSHLLFLADEGDSMRLFVIRIDGRSMGRRPFYEIGEPTAGASWSMKPSEIAQR